MSSIPTIPLGNLGLAFIPVAVVIAVLYRWTREARTSVIAMARMLAQLLLIGYALTYIFNSESAPLILAILTLMLVFASWIALRPLSAKPGYLYLKAFAAIALGGLATLFIVTQFVLDLDPWFAPRYLVPLAGMMFANAMNTVSLAAERYESERDRGADYVAARRNAFNASLIPMINSLLAVGLVSLPGMMTGQILSGVDPLLAVRYQIVVMCMIFGAAGIASASYLLLLRPGTRETTTRPEQTALEGKDQ